MPPLGPLLKNDGPACRVCGCTQNNACAPLGCGWAKTEKIDAGELCTACSGTDADMAEALSRANEQLAQLTTFSIASAVRIAKSAKLRKHARLGLVPRPASRGRRSA